MSLRDRELQISIGCYNFGGGGGKTPDPPPPPPPPPEDIDVEPIQQAKDAERKRLANRGRKSTILGGGLSNQSSASKNLLGG